ncbi:hypothetical protein [Litoribacillus peritrichatus]|uniref:Uncharacterized protein n=1 Tax=Litoribacillus peritrichatus TaxID=718191 RepID=A0ABP7N4C5_9GAMM
MPTREEKKKLKEKARERSNPSFNLLGPDGKEVAKVLYKGFDFPWLYGNLQPSENFSDYSELFEKVSSLKKLEEESSESGNEELEEKYSDEARNILNKISDMGFKILNRKGEEIKYTTFNIVGLEWEYK